ncbi:hypothetical protein [Deinococcus sp.]|uniref:hypothetical protein n=1 Tax=Deinococcus sp. TaxID=47478 RepID=UPI003C7C52B7
MKKVIMMVAAMGMFGGAFAETSTVNQPLTAKVTNVCTYAVDSQVNVDGKTFKQGNKDLGTYNALSATNSTIDMGSLYIFRCTSGTPFHVNYLDGAELKEGNIVISGKNSTNLNRKLNVLFTITTSDQLDTDNGDIHSAGAIFTIPTGQWKAVAGEYGGSLFVEVTYN